MNLPLLEADIRANASRYGADAEDLIRRATDTAETTGDPYPQTLRDLWERTRAEYGTFGIDPSSPEAPPTPINGFGQQLRIIVPPHIPGHRP